MQIDSPKDCIILVDKVKGVTSFNALNAIKRYVNKKAGHAGTLDRFATGLLIVMCGNKTKLCEKYMGFDKTYIAVIKLGEETQSDDLEGQVINKSDIIPSIDEIKRTVNDNFTGVIMQAPPRFSAIHINGKRAYKMALKNEDFEIKKREVNIKKSQIIEYQYPYLKMEFEVSKGTYIRSIARDLGQLLGCYGHLVELRRTKIGIYDVKDAVKSDEITSSVLPSSALVDQL